jgi:hypothetical protein
MSIFIRKKNISDNKTAYQQRINIKAAGVSPSFTGPWRAPAKQLTNLLLFFLTYAK